MPTASTVNRSARFGSSANSFRRCVALSCLWCALSAAQALHLVRGLRVAVLGLRFARGAMAGTPSWISKLFFVRFLWGFDAFWSLNVPESKTSAKCVEIVSRAAIRRQFLQFLYIASTQNNLVGLQRG